MALATIPIIPRDGTITLADATGSPITCTVVYEDGDASITGLRQGQFSQEVFRDRGLFYGARNVQEEEVEISFSAHVVAFTDATEKLLSDAVRKTGAFASGVSQLGANADVWALKVTFAAERTNYGASADTSVAFTYVRDMSVDFAEGVPSKFTFKGKAMLVDSAGITISG
jgi:hypothetical protein